MFSRKIVQGYIQSFFDFSHLAAKACRQLWAKHISVTIVCLNISVRGWILRSISFWHRPRSAIFPISLNHFENTSITCHTQHVKAWRISRYIVCVAAISIFKTFLDNLFAEMIRALSNLMGSKMSTVTWFMSMLFCFLIMIIIILCLQLINWNWWTLVDNKCSI